MKQNEYAIYLRKSRKDLEAEAMGLTDTLVRHRAELLGLAKKQQLTVTAIYEEVVSGESVAARPEMQKLLTAIEQGAFAGVLVVEVERLARGDTVDQGIVAQTFKYSNTKIVTPPKTYDPNDEFDEEYFEFGLFMSRREYKTINRRLQRGREASMREGKYVGNKPPYGYRRVKLEKEKGFMLSPVPDQAKIVKQIYEWYIGAEGQRLGTSLIVRQLNTMGTPSPTGQDWTNSVVRGILTNQTYTGLLRWGNRAGIKHVVDGRVSLSRPRANPEDVKLFQGLHEPLVTQAQFDLAQQCISLNKSRPGPKQAKTTNPLAGLIYCDQCGRSMVRRPYKDRTPSCLCIYTSCKTVGADLDIVEGAVLDGLRGWLEVFELNYAARSDHSDHTEQQLVSAVSTTEKALKKIAIRESKAYELVESGIYTPEVFVERMAALTQERDLASNQLTTQRDQLHELLAAEQSKRELIPNIRHVLESYPLAQSAAEKNTLLKSVLSRVDYHKTQRARWGSSDLSLTLHPILPNTK